jgi:hypothetical protein
MFYIQGYKTLQFQIIPPFRRHCIGARINQSEYPNDLMQDAKTALTVLLQQQGINATEKIFRFE